METKFCRDCDCARPLSEFTKNRNSRDGYAFYCKEHARRRHRASKVRREGPPARRYPNDVEVPEGYKWCPDCGAVLPLTSFGKNAASSRGITSYCKPCHNARGRRSKEAVGGERTYHLRRRYGITAQDFDAMLDEQGGLCAICVSAPAQHVDHDHETGRVRRLLCFNCNGGLGQFRDDPVVLRAAARYVEHHRGRPEQAGADPSSPSSLPPASRRSHDPARLELRRRAAGCPTHGTTSSVHAWRS